MTAKKIIVILIIGILVFIILASSIFYIYLHKEYSDVPDIEASIFVENINGQGERKCYICNSNEYYYACDNKVYTYPENKAVITIDSFIENICSTKDEIIISSDNKLFIYNADTYEHIRTVILLGALDISTIFACENTIFCSITDEDYSLKVRIIDLESGAEITHTEFLNETKNSCNEHYYGELNDNYNSISFASNNEIQSIVITNKSFTPVFRLHTNYGGYYDDRNLYIITRMSKSIRFTSESDNTEDVVEFPVSSGYYSPNYVIENNKLIIVGTILDFKPFTAKPVSFTPELINHGYDTVIIVDLTTKEIASQNTEKFERILYADSQKAITYHKGQYLTYSLSDWKVIKKQNADEIKNGGSYTFESCGEYIFVFDDKQNKLINTIEI